jgi:Peroxisomal biogenesis factor 11 (PEX11)
MSTSDAKPIQAEGLIVTGVKPPLSDFKFPEKEKGDNDDDDDQTDETLYVYHPTTLLVVSLSQGLQKKATPFQLSSWVKLALTLDGRDKITKVCQYVARMLAWWFAAAPHQRQRFEALQSSLATSRKAFRLGKSLNEIQKLQDGGLLELVFGGKGGGSDPAWKIIGSSLKMIGLMGFWAGDNVNFLSGSTLFDDYRCDPKDRLDKRNQLKTQASHFANRFYFFGALAGLLTGFKDYLSFRQTTLRQSHERLVEATKAVAETDRRDEARNKQLWKKAKEALDKAREKQFSLFLTLLKVCTVVVALRSQLVVLFF